MAASHAAPSSAFKAGTSTLLVLTRVLPDERAWGGSGVPPAHHGARDAGELGGTLQFE